MIEAIENQTEPRFMSTLLHSDQMKGIIYFYYDIFTEISSNLQRVYGYVYMYKYTKVYCAIPTPKAIMRA